MDINLKANKDNALTMYVEILNPILKLKRREKELLAAILGIYVENQAFGYDNIFKIVNSTETKKRLRSETSFSEPSFNNHLKQLRDKGIIANGRVLPMITLNMPDGPEGININYNVTIELDGAGQENQEDNKENS